MLLDLVLKTGHSARNSDAASPLPGLDLSVERAPTTQVATGQVFTRLVGFSLTGSRFLGISAA